MSPIDFDYVCRLVRERSAIVLEPGKEPRSIRYAEPDPALCVFELIYFARPDSYMEGRNLYQARLRMGMELAREHPIEERHHRVGQRRAHARDRRGRTEEDPGHHGHGVLGVERRPAKCDGPCPVVVEFHGGPEAQSTAGFSGYAQLFVDAGFTFVQPNVRGSAGYGKSWLHSDDGPKRMAIITNVALSVLSTQVKVDTEKLRATRTGAVNTAPISYR